MRIWDGSAWDGPPRWFERESFVGHTDRALGIAFHPDGQHLASVGGDWTLRVWQRGQSEAVRSIDLRQIDNDDLKTPASDYFAVTYSGDGRQLFTASSAGPVVVLDATTGRFVTALRGHVVGPIRGLTLRPDGKELATASWDRSVRVWDLVERREKLTLAHHSEPVNGVAYSPDGHWLASASYDQTVRLWDVRSGDELRPPLMHPGGVFGVAISPDGKLLASAGNDGFIRLWDTADWHERPPLVGHRAAVRAVVFSPDGRWLASGGHDWTVPPVESLGWRGDSGLSRTHRSRAWFGVQSGRSNAGTPRAMTSQSSSGMWMRSAGDERTRLVDPFVRLLMPLGLD